MEVACLYIGSLKEKKDKREEKEKRERLRVRTNKRESQGIDEKF
jgi:hypothetical protein